MRSSERLTNVLYPAGGLLTRERKAELRDNALLPQHHAIPKVFRTGPDGNPYPVVENFAVCGRFLQEPVARLWRNVLSLYELPDGSLFYTDVRQCPECHTIYWFSYAFRSTRPSAPPTAQ